MGFLSNDSKRFGAALGAFAVVCVIGASLSGQAGAAGSSVGLGTADPFAVLGGAGVTNTGPSIIRGDVGSCPTAAITGFPPGLVLGTRHANDAVACGAQADTTTAYNDAAGRAPTKTYGGPTDLGGSTLVAGVYKSPSSFAITGTLTLNGQNNPDATFIFQAASTVITAPNSSVALINGAQACNVFWQVGSSGTVGVSSRFVGTMLALTSITANTNATVAGRLLARNGSVTLDSNSVSRPSCAPPVTTTSTTAATTTSSTSATTSTTAVGATTTSAAPTTSTTVSGATTTSAAPTTSTTIAGATTTTSTTVAGTATTATQPTTTSTTAAPATGTGTGAGTTVAGAAGESAGGPSASAQTTATRAQRTPLDVNALPRTGGVLLWLPLLSVSLLAGGVGMRRGARRSTARASTSSTA